MIDIPPPILHAVALAASAIGMLYLVISKRKSVPKSKDKDYDVFIPAGAMGLIAGLAAGVQGSGRWA